MIRMGGTVSVIFFAVLVVSVLSSGSPAWPDYPWYNASRPFEERAHELTMAMTPDELISQMIKESAAIPRLGVPAYSYWCEAAHGVAGAGLATVFPNSIGRGAAFDAELEMRMAQAVAMEARAKHTDAVKHNGSSTDGYSLTLYAPNVNLVVHPLWGRAMETFGEDPYLSGLLGVAFVKGLQFNDSAPKYLVTSAMAKHFVAYNVDSDFAAGGHNAQYRLGANTPISPTDYEQTYVKAFLSLIGKGHAKTVMCSYNAIDGIPMCASPLLQSQLRERMNFSSVIFSDGGAVRYIWEYHNFTNNITTAAVAALKAGVDLNSGGARSDFGYNHLPEAYSLKLVTKKELQTAVERLMLLRMELGMFDPPEKVPFRNVPMSVVNSVEHRSIARQYAAESMVLLLNLEDSGQPMLPLQSSVSKVAFIGPHADNKGALLGNYAGCRLPFDGPIDPECTLITPLQGFNESVPASFDVSYTQGCHINTTLSGGLEKAKTAASNSDAVVMVLGLSTSGYEQPIIEGEAHDRVSVLLPKVQQDLLEAVCSVSRRVVLVLMNGGPVSPTWALQNPQCVKAIIELWYPGGEGGAALAKVLLGRTSPSGRLPVSIPVSDDALPPPLDINMTSGRGRTYRYFLDEQLFQFGYGLSFAGPFNYGSLKLSATTVSPVDTIEVSVVVEHPGLSDIVADEVVQLYVSLQVTATERSQGARSVPIYELKRARRISLSPSEQKMVKFDLAMEDLKLMDSDGSMTVIPGKYSLWVGGRGPVAGTGTGKSVHEPLKPLHAEFSVQ